MALVVQKYGGSSVADADGIKRVAQRIVATARPATRSSWWSPRWATPPTSCIDLANQVSPLPPGARARHAADRGRADLDGAAGHGDRQPGPRGALVHRLPGRRDHRLGRTARRGSSTSRPAGSAARWTTARSRSWPASRACRRTARTSPRWAGAAPTPPRWRWPPRSAPTSARSTPTWTACSPPTRGSCRPPGGSRGSATRRCWRWPPAAPRCCMLRCVEYARRYDIPIHVRSSFSNQARAPGSATASADAEEEPGWSRRSSPGWRTTGARRRSRSSACRTRSARRPGSSAAIADAGINIDMIVQNVSAARHRAAPTSRSRCRAPTARRRMTALRAAAGGRSASSRCSTTTRSARSRWSARACGRTPGSARRSSARWPRRA